MASRMVVLPMLFFPDSNVTRPRSGSSRPRMPRKPSTVSDGRCNREAMVCTAFGAWLLLHREKEIQPITSRSRLPLPELDKCHKVHIGQSRHDALQHSTGPRHRWPNSSASGRRCSCVHKIATQATDGKEMHAEMVQDQMRFELKVSIFRPLRDAVRPPAAPSCPYRECPCQHPAVEPLGGLIGCALRVVSVEPDALTLKTMIAGKFSARSKWLIGVMFTVALALVSVTVAATVALLKTASGPWRPTEAAVGQDSGSAASWSPRNKTPEQLT